MKISKILYSPIFPVLLAGVLLIVGFWFGGSTFKKPASEVNSVMVASVQNVVTDNSNDAVKNIPVSYQNIENTPAPTQIIIKQNPSFNDVVLASCSSKSNPYKGAQVQWDAQVSEYAHTGGIRFRVIDAEHPLSQVEKHGHFWGIFLGSARDPRYTEDGSEYDQKGLKDWGEKWDISWVKYILDVYGGIGDNDRDWDTIFKVTATIDGVDCDPYLDGGYIETSVVKIEKKSAGGFSLENHFAPLKYRTVSIKEDNNHARIDIQYPQFIGDEKVKNLNKHIQDFVLEQLSRDREMVRQWMSGNARNPLACSDSSKYQYECSVNLAVVYRVVSMVHDIISIEVTMTDYTGGGNGNHDRVTAINWDLQNDRILTAQDLFCRTDYPLVLSPLAYQSFVNQNKDPLSIDKDTLDRIRDGTANPENYTNILLGYKGITVVFQPYTILSGGIGVMRIPLSYSLVQDTLCLPWS